MIRKISLTTILVVGVVWVVATLLFNLWSKAPAADHLTNALQPAFTNAGIAQQQVGALVSPASGPVTPVSSIDPV